MADLVQIIRGGLRLAVPLKSVVGFPKVAILSDVKAYNAGGGTFTSGAWRTRDLNTETDADAIVSLSSNRFTPASGTYLVIWSCPAYAVEYHVSRLYNYTQSSVSAVGSSEYEVSTSAVSNRSFGSALITANGTDAYQLEHYCSTTKATNGFGVNSNLSGTDSVYTIINLIKVS